MRPLLVDDDQAIANSRICAIRLTGLTLRWMENWRRNVGDYESAMILLAVVAIITSRMVRPDLGAEYRDMGNSVPDEYFTRCNVSSIAAATGLNRETTRRKVQDLVARGILIRLEDNSFRFTEGYLQRPHVAELVRQQLDSFTRVANDLIKDGIYKD